MPTFDLIFDRVSFSYDKKEVLRDFSLYLQNGEILALMAPSGIGKSTILNLAAGLIKPQSGVIINNAERISYAFQEPRLFPWMSALGNVNAVLSAKKETKPQAKEALSFVGLEGSERLHPSELSGGMKSRVALARAIAYDGDLYLLDEPFAALDEELKNHLCKKLREHIKARGASALFVTHQRADAEQFADRIVEL